MQVRCDDLPEPKPCEGFEPSQGSEVPPLHVKSAKQKKEKFCVLRALCERKKDVQLQLCGGRYGKVIISLTE